MSDLQRFAKILSDEADEMSTYARNLERVNGGGETAESEKYWLKSSILSEVAKAATKAVEREVVSS